MVQKIRGMLERFRGYLSERVDPFSPEYVLTYLFAIPIGWYFGGVIYALFFAPR